MLNMKIILILLIFLWNAQAKGKKFNMKTCLKDLGIGSQVELRSRKKDLDIDTSKLFVRFYSKKYRKGIVLRKRNLNIINFKQETKILVSGWTEGHLVPWILDMKDIYINSTPHNVMIYDYDEYDSQPYYDSVSVSRNVGRRLGNFIAQLVYEIKLNLNRTHLIGHSMGSHVVGFAGKQVYKKLSRKVGRITSLDAAGPLFIWEPKTNRISLDDAQFVDAIHTNDHIFGFGAPYAHVDIYVENAIIQPECTEVLEFFEKHGLTCKSVWDLIACSHKKSHQLWSRTILVRDYYAIDKSGAQRIVIGEHMTRDHRGVFYYHSASF